MRFFRIEITVSIYKDSVTWDSPESGYSISWQAIVELSKD